MSQTQTNSKKTTEPGNIRQKTEEILSAKLANKKAPTKKGDIQKLLHELEVHQIELEIQNEELRSAVDLAESATEKYTNLYDFAPSGYFTLNYDGHITNLNLNGARMLGMERGRLINYKLKHFVSGDYKATFQDFYQKIFETGIKEACEVKLEHLGNHSYIYLEGIISDNGNSCFLTATDTSQRHKTEEILKESEKQLKLLNATKDKFFSIIAHDLRNPFTSIIGFSSLLMRYSETEKAGDIKKYAKMINDSSLRAMDLLKNLMEWASLQTGQISFKPKPLALANVTANVIEFLSDQANHKLITIKNEIDKNFVAHADEEMISTVLRNLISNGLKFTHPGGEVTITAFMKTDELTVVVCDNGVGMDKSRVNIIFKIDENVTTRGTQNEEGTGLGLILCKEFILRHKGKIWVESILGTGSKFFFSIPNPV